MNIWLSLLICIAGLVIYAVSNNSKAQAIALDCFWVGLLVFLLRFAGSISVHP
jgi:hypothetical protein